MSAIASDPPLDENSFSRAKTFQKRRYSMYSGDLNNELVRYLNGLTPLDENSFSRATTFQKRRYSMYSGDLNNKLVWYLNDQMVWCSSHGLNNKLKVCYSGNRLHD